MCHGAAVHSEQHGGATWESAGVGQVDNLALVEVVRRRGADRLLRPNLQGCWARAHASVR